MMNIERALKELGVDQQTIFSLGDLEKLCQMTGLPLGKVMKYLRTR